MSNPIVPYAGSHKIDISALVGKLFDLDPRAMQGLRTELEGFPEVTVELSETVSVHADAGVPQDVYEHFAECNSIIAQIDQCLVQVEKLAEVLRESRAYYVNARQNDISMIVDALRSRALRRKNSSLLSQFEKTIRYATQVGLKAARTRRRNEAEQAAENAPVEPVAADQPAKVA